MIMNTKKLKLPVSPDLLSTFIAVLNRLQPIVLFVVLLVIWCFGPSWLRGVDETIGNVDQSIWLLVVLSLISFLLVCTICWWLLQHFWMLLDLPHLDYMVSQFNTLPLWQQLGFYWVSFASLLAAALGCLIAIC